MRLVFIVLAAALSFPAAAQIHWGIKGGVPLTEVTEVVGGSGNLLSRSPRWTVGPVLELDLPAGLGVEVNALFRRIGYEQPTANPVQQIRESVLDFPLLAKYKFPGILARPYVSGGWSYRSIGTLVNLSGPKNSNGFILATGVRVGALFAQISPELRYTRWSRDSNVSGFQIRRNQVEVLVGITF